MDKIISEVNKERYVDPEPWLVYYFKMRKITQTGERMGGSEEREEPNQREIQWLLVKGEGAGREARRRGEGKVRGQRGNMKEKSNVSDGLNKIKIDK